MIGWLAPIGGQRYEKSSPVMGENVLPFDGIKLVGCAAILVAMLMVQLVPGTGGNASPSPRGA